LLAKVRQVIELLSLVVTASEEEKTRTYRTIKQHLYTKQMQDLLTQFNSAVEEIVEKLRPAAH